MATPLSADQLLTALKREGLVVVEHDGWRTHNRNHKGPWGPVHGVMVHHTVTSGAERTVAICQTGYSGLPGPLCQIVITKDGDVHLIGNGRANHAGLGDDDVLRAVIAEQQLPVDDEANTDGNRHFYGMECENLGDGEDPWPEVQLDAIERAAAALCRAHGWTAGSVLRHLDWQPGKVDPRGVDWQALRARIAKRLGSAPPKTTPAPVTPSVDLSRLIAAARSNPPAAGTPVTYGAGVRLVEAALVDEGLLARPYMDGHFGTATVRAYGRWQLRCGYRGAAADGIPGRDSLRRLGLKHGFKVVD
ncbi:N-acetylmuramoyl-L-alanine amidase [Streptomyces sp. NPDC018693]|uniref:N-acetylmuramoyl-L-alanine amidase n=1 Tax=unclassified Streptomyces TaxID=2593676 RepID=UPI0037A5821F